MLEDLLVCLLIETGGEEETGSASDWSRPDLLLTSQGGLLLESLFTLLISSLTCVFKMSCLFPTVVIVRVAPPTSFCTTPNAASILPVSYTS